MVKKDYKIYLLTCPRCDFQQQTIVVGKELNYKKYKCIECKKKGKLEIFKPVYLETL